VSAGATRARLAWGLRPYQRARVGLCRTVRTAPTVQLVGRVRPDGQGSLVLRGVMTCGSVHSCPSCAAAIVSRRAAELTTALDNHRRDRTAIVTFTLRHHAGMPLLVLRTLLGRAYSELFAGRKGQELREELGILGTVRSAEQTWGQNGWHPHLHALWFFDRHPREDWQATVTARWIHCVQIVYGRMIDTCRGAERNEETQELRSRVATVLGAKVGMPSPKARALAGTSLAERAAAYRKQLETMGGLLGILPDAEHAVKAEICATDAAGKYLSKLGLEVAGIHGKVAALGHYTHWQLGALAARGHRWAGVLWAEHSAAMMGARQLTWSRGLRETLGLAPERPDEVLAAETETEPGDEDTPLAELEGPVWDLFARQRRQLWVAELHQAYADGTLDRTLWGESRPSQRPTGPAPVWWHRAPFSGALTEGAEAWQALHAARESLNVARRYVSAAERDLLREELRDHLYFDLGLAPF
jgi:hypothetical protein